MTRQDKQRSFYCKIEGSANIKESEDIQVSKTIMLSDSDAPNIVKKSLKMIDYQKIMEAVEISEIYECRITFSENCNILSISYIQGGIKKYVKISVEDILINLLNGYTENKNYVAPEVVVY